MVPNVKAQGTIAWCETSVISEAMKQMMLYDVVSAAAGGERNVDVTHLSLRGDQRTSVDHDDGFAQIPLDKL